MSEQFYKLNNNLPVSQKILLLNDMTIALDGLVEQGKFDEVELTSLYSQLSGVLNREFFRNVSLGNTLSDYNNWTHIHDYPGYSIWKIAPTDYDYIAGNELYFDNKKLEKRGEAGAESATAFDFVYLYNGDSGSGYTDNSSEASTESGTEFEVMDSTSDYLYLGEATTFAGASFDWETRGSGYTLKIEYYDGTSGILDWVELTANTNNLDDDTNNFESNGKISWDVPSGWGTNSVNGQTKYWIRISCITTDPTTTGSLYRVIPYNSVISLLSLSSTEIGQENWAWCYYNASVYVTIKNTGNSSFEGTYYIKASSSVANLKNFFIYNHEYKADYKDINYDNATTFGTGDLLADGTVALTADWNVGAFDITAIEFKGDLIGNADTVTTNANLTGEVTSTGNASTVADNIIDEANLKLETTPTNNFVLTADNAKSGGMKWASSGAGDVSKVGTPADNQVGVWTGDGTIEGTSGLTYNGTAFGINGNITLTGTVDGVDIATDVAANTTHRGSDGSNHSKVGTNETAIGLNTTHRTSNGTDHGYIDQDVTNASSPVFNAENFTNMPITGVRDTFVNADLSSGVLTITHSLGLSTPYTLNVTIADNSQEMLLPDTITFTTNTIVVDLSSYGTLTGTYGYYYA